MAPSIHCVLWTALVYIGLGQAAVMETTGLALKRHIEVQCGISQASFAVDMDVCSMIDGIIDEPPDSCTRFMMEKFLEENSAACFVALECRKDQIYSDYVHGKCLHLCENKDFNTTECRDPLLIKVGLKHGRVCGTMPANIAFAIYGFGEMWMVFSIQAVTRIVDCAANIIEIASFKSTDSVDSIIFTDFMRPGLNDLIDAFVQCFVIICVIRSVFEYLDDASGICRWVVLSSAFQFGPFVFSQLSVLAFVEKLFVYLCRGSRWYPQIRPRLLGLHGSHEEDIGVSYQRVPVRSLREWMSYRDIAAVAASFGVAVFLAAFAIAIPMYLCAFWGLLAYVHIAIISLGMMLFTMSLTLAALLYITHRYVQYVGFCAMQKICNGKFESIEKDDLSMKKMELRQAWLMLFLENVHHGGAVALQLVSAVLILSGFFVNTFLLYITGDYLVFHESFFHELEKLFTEIPLPSFPEFHVFVNPEVTFEIFQRMFTFKAISPNSCMEVAVISAALNSVFKVCWCLGRLARKIRASYNKK